MKNYEQIRAANAFDAATNPKNDFAGVDKGKSIAKKVPTQIRENGFLGALAFAIESKSGYETVFKAIMKHLPSVNCDFGINCDGSLESFFIELTQKDSDVLRAVTEESMAYLNYLRRFAKGS
jgi:CRISPR/Cas system CMR-associated protein Cmr5 small subunit